VNEKGEKKRIPGDKTTDGSGIKGKYFPYPGENRIQGQLLGTETKRLTKGRIKKKETKGGRKPVKPIKRGSTDDAVHLRHQHEKDSRA